MDRSATHDQLAALFLLKGTVKQRIEALEYIGEHEIAALVRLRELGEPPVKSVTQIIDPEKSYAMEEIQDLFNSVKIQPDKATVRFRIETSNTGEYQILVEITNDRHGSTQAGMGCSDC